MLALRQWKIITWFFIGNLTVFTAIKNFGDQLRAGEVTTISC